MKLIAVFLEIDRHRRDLVCVTDSYDKWLGKENEDRVLGGWEPCSADDFVTEEVEYFIHGGNNETNI